MKPSQALALHRQHIREVVAKFHAKNPRVFGSVLRGDDTEDSDLDLLVDPTENTTLFDICGIMHELRQLLGIPVDVATPNALPEKSRERILAEARPL